MWVGFCSVLVVPSPKSHATLLNSPLDVLAVLGWLAIKRGEEAGLAQISEAIAVAQAHRERGMEGAAETRRGFWLLTLGQPAAALSAFARRVALREQTNDRVQLSSGLAGFAAANEALGDHRTARASRADPCSA